VGYINDVASVVVVVIVRLEGMFRNRRGYFNETWWAIRPGFFFIFAIGPILWPTGGHLENPTCHLRANGCS
jgi:hypothetical protein